MIYNLWQNIINSYQLWKKRKNEIKIKSQLFTLLYVMLGMVNYIVAFY